MRLSQERIARVSERSKVSSLRTAVRRGGLQDIRFLSELLAPGDFSFLPEMFTND